MTSFTEEVAAGQRFEFGSNWSKFLRSLDEERVRRAEVSLQQLTGLEHFGGATFCDIGSGSGLFSLAAYRLGARVTSFDYDPASVACAASLQSAANIDKDRWRVLSGSILDDSFVAGLGTFDVVYSWGVLHHTGRMFDAFANAARLVASGGLLCIAIYNDQGRASVTWGRVKRLYNALPRPLRPVLLAAAWVRLWGPTMLRDLVRGRPGHSWRTYRSERGMSAWRDVVDWVGGLPFEVAKPEVVFRYFRERGFELLDLRTCAGGIGCNEYVLRRQQ